MTRSILNFHFRLSWLLIIGLLATQNSKAQDASAKSSGISAKSSGITVTVSQPVKITASKLRLLLPIRVETRDGASVLKTLKNHQEAVIKELKTFGVDDSFIDFSSPLVTAGIPGVEDPDASRKAARNQVIQMRNMNPQLKAQYPVPSLEDEDDSELPVVYAADANLVVDWKLEKQSDEAAILLPSKVKRFYEQKDLTGKKLRVELTDVEQSLVEPLLSSTNYISYPVQASGNNRLYYVGEMSPEQEKAAYAEAVKKAKGQAELIALSSGLRLGKIRSIQTSTVGDFTSLQANLYMAMRSDTTDGKLREKNDREVLGTDLDGLKTQIHLVVVFDFE
ncbi:MAG: SIMPL domain-containing protein [Planctomycetota bacterium]|nr:SIMPL domain-containing protein [Planctomycetota bacterium]